MVYTKTNDWRLQKGIGALIKHVAALVASAILAWAAWSNALGNVTMLRQPEFALGAVGLGDYPAARLAETKMIRSPRRFNPQTLAALARSSLKAQAINSTALRLLAVEPKSNDGVKKSAALLFLSSRVSRRDVGTQLALVEFYVSKEDARHTIYHYDSAMRVSNEVEPVLFPILADALEGSNIQQALALSIKSSPRWLPSFIGYVVGRSKNSTGLANAIMLAGGLPKQPEAYRSLETQILGALASAKEFTMLRSYFLSLSGADSGIFQIGEFTSNNTDGRFLPLTWQTFGSSMVSVRFESEDHSHQKKLDVEISADERAIAARKLLFLSAGQRRVSINYEFLDRGKDASAMLTLECLDAPATQVIWQMDLRAVSGVQRKSGVSSIPEKCVAQYLAVNVAGGSANDGMRLLVTGISIK